MHAQVDPKEIEKPSNRQANQQKPLLAWIFGARKNPPPHSTAPRYAVAEARTAGRTGPAGRPRPHAPTRTGRQGAEPWGDLRDRRANGAPAFTSQHSHARWRQVQPIGLIGTRHGDQRESDSDGCDDIRATLGHGEPTGAASRFAFFTNIIHPPVYVIPRLRRRAVIPTSSGAGRNHMNGKIVLVKHLPSDDRHMGGFSRNLRFLRGIGL